MSVYVDPSCPWLCMQQTQPHFNISYYIILYRYTHNTNDFVDDSNKYNNNYSSSKNDNDESKIVLELVMVWESGQP